VSSPDGTAVDLTELRVNRGLSQAAAARSAKVNKSVWGRAENGERVSPANALKIASFFDLQVTDIWPLETEAAA
jgi:DNA-binding XRE family transcriptional regulator